MNSINIAELKALIQCVDELHNCSDCLKYPIKNTFKKCLSSSLAATSKPNEKLEIESVLDYLKDELNTGHWKEVPVEKRHIFTAASFAKVLCYANLIEQESKQNLEELLKTADLGLLLGAPLFENDTLLADVATLLSRKLQNYYNYEENIALKRTNIHEELKSFAAFNGSEVNTLKCLSLREFQKLYFEPKIPVKLKDCMNHWPASTKWLDINYFLKIASCRTVPVEVGSHYTDENWSQKLMTLEEFIKHHFLTDSKEVVYLAQHNLFDQIIELKNDICIPDYCGLSMNYDANEEIDINAWFGPKGTVSPLHHDPKDNLLAQVFGTKQIILYSPTDSEFLYPHEGKLLNNTAKVNPIELEENKYPEFKKACAFKCLLQPGEMLYIPKKWWHHVTAFDKSFSVSFWWD